MLSDYPKQNFTLYATFRVNEDGTFEPLPAIFDKVVYNERKRAVYADPLSIVLADVEKLKNCPLRQGCFSQRLRNRTSQFENVYVFDDLSTLKFSDIYDNIVIQHITNPGSVVQLENCLSVPGYTPVPDSTVYHFNQDFVNSVYHYKKS